MKDISDYLNQTIECDCGHYHKTTLKHVEISEHAHRKIPELLHLHHYENIFLIADNNTYQAAGNEIFELLQSKGFNIVKYVFDDVALVPDETAVGCIMTSIPDDTDLILSVGCGTLGDLGKYVSHKLKLPFYIVATAPSMDGFASNVSCLIINHMKTTIVTHIPEAVIADIHVLASAPPKMIAAGVGDILGKYICLLDWKISHIITGEYYCNFVENIVRSSISAITENIDALQQSETDAVKKVMEGLVLSGIAMSYVGNSRPASGSEHHLSHFWELNFLENNRPPVLHGIKVGIGTVECFRLYDMLFQVLDDDYFPDFDHARKQIDSFSYDEWKTNIEKIYGKSAEEVIKLEQMVQKNAKDTVLKRIDTIEKIWPDIYITIKAYLPKLSKLTDMLQTAGASSRPYEEEIHAELVRDSILYAKELRNRYGLLQLLFDLGYLEQFADQINQILVMMN